MQSSTPKKNPYLVRYKSEVGAQQKFIRDKLGIPSDKADSPSDSSKIYATENIPSIDDEAEASLQFFKKNLLPRNTTGEIEKPSLFNPSYLLSRSTDNQTLAKSASSQSMPRSRQPIAKLEDETFLYTSKPKFESIRPVPFKPGALSEPRRDISNQTLPKEQFDYQVRQITTLTKSQGKSPERPSRKAQQLDNNNSRNYDKIQVHEDSTDRSNNSSKTRPKSTQLVELASQPSPASPASTFSRKPLYNSLLRAHDSIRLKVNRPKARSKSKEPVDDTVLDDSIQLAELPNPNSTDPNERGVDIKRISLKRKSKKKSKEVEDATDKIPVRNFTDVRVVKVQRTEDDRSVGVTVKVEDGNIVVARILAGSLADKQGALQVGDIILAVNNREVYTPEQLQEQLRKMLNDDTILLKIVPSYREELPTLCIYLRALFTYDANQDTLLPCKEVGVSFNHGDILEVVNQEDPNWWQARRVDSENLQTGLIPSQDLEERRRAFVPPDYDLATRTSIFGTKIARKSKRKEIYNVGQNNDFDKAELQLYEEVCRTPAFERRTLVLIGAHGVGKQALKARLIEMDPERFGTPLPHTSRLPREGEEDAIHYHFVTREKMEEDIIDGKYLEYGEYDGALYGTKLDSIREVIGSGKVCVLDCSPTCLKVLKTPDYLPFVAFIAAPTIGQLRYMNEWARSNRNYATLDRAFSRQSRRTRTLQDYAYDFFEDEDLNITVEESARLFRVYENYFDIVLVNDSFERTLELLREAIDALSMAPQWIPITWIYGA